MSNANRPDTESEHWRKLLSGEDKSLGVLSRVFRSLPSAPRCKLCYAPFKGPFAVVLKVAGFRPWTLNRQICRVCVVDLGKHKGGAEIPVSLMFADVRGSTSLAERLTASEYTEVLERFFRMAYQAVDSESGVIDSIVGDGVMAMWIPGFVGQNHPQRAVSAGRKLARSLVVATNADASFPVGVGVHTGVAYVGVVGEARSRDFTVLGDIPNTTARLGSAAAEGQLVMSDEIARAAGVDTSKLEERHLPLKGKTETLASWIETFGPSGQPA